MIWFRSRMVRKFYCPYCQEAAPAYAMLPLHDFGVDAQGKVVTEVSGYRVACQAQSCGAIYQVGPTGTSRVSPGAFPPMHQAPATAGAESIVDPKPQSMPTPRERPPF